MVFGSLYALDFSAWEKVHTLLVAVANPAEPAKVILTAEKRTGSSFEGDDV